MAWSSLKALLTLLDQLRVEILLYIPRIGVLWLGSRPLIIFRPWPSGHDVYLPNAMTEMKI